MRREMWDIRSYSHLNEIGYEHGPSPAKLIGKVDVGEESANSSEGVHSLFVSLSQVNKQLAVNDLQRREKYRLLEVPTDQSRFEIVPSN